VSEWRGRAFGLELHGNFAAPDLAHRDGEAGSGPLTEIRHAARLTDTPGAEVLLEQALPGGRFAISRHGETGYILQHSYYGDYRVSLDGSEIVCAPCAMPDWAWQRFLTAQPLPLAALLCGYEVLHASVVAVAGSALLVMGASGAGKTSVALQLAARGAGFMADDVAALELSDGAVQVHAGPRLASVAGAELDRAPEPALARWRRLGALDGEVRIQLPPPERASLPVGAVYLLRRVDEGKEPSVVPRPGSATALLGGTFNTYVHDRQRLVRQIEVTGWLADHVPLREVAIPPGATAAMVAEAVLQSM